MRTRGARTRLVAATATFAMVLGGILAATPAAAAVGGAVSGTVSATSGPLANIRVTFFPLWGSGDAAGTALTNSSGAYSVTGLEQGTYRVRFAPEDQASTYAAAWWGGGSLESESNILTLGAAAVTGVNVTLAAGGSISGTITTGSSTDKGAAAAFLKNSVTGQWERFSRWANANSSGAYTIRGLASGQYLLRFAPQSDNQLISTRYWQNKTFWAEAQLVTISGTGTVSGRDATLPSNGRKVARVAGSNRYATSALIAGVNPDFANPDSVFIVNGTGYADALSAGPAAAHLGSPVLLTRADSLAPEITTKLSSMDPDTIYIVGGTPSISAAVEAQLAPYANVGVVRIAGPDRYATSRLVAQTIFGDGADTAYIATGANFPDALSAGPAAAVEGGPVLLVNGAAATSDADTLAALQGLGVSKVVIAGSEGTISAGIEASLRSAASVTEVYRRSGNNRYTTSVLLAQGSIRLADAVFLATGTDFPDALAGSALAGYESFRSPIYLVRPDCVPQAVFDEIARVKPAEIYILGGTTTVGDILGSPAC
ncbi:putative cell wall-binding protein [Leifsonia sp. AK011]|uniref:cell wall-binding repeat-containing protein n=1 Tax=Leifsonia sp. AK011 TaxID=2723075 RepID=UPI0015C90750|nr:cell wall-binding repeat-containing protein [Leifsonia sp. AK011]NYF11204.1 putative cell wall-binding protein [Leifsonia sp. AK011]